VLATQIQYNCNNGGSGKNRVMPKAHPTLPNHPTISRIHLKGYSS